MFNTGKAKGVKVLRFFFNRSWWIVRDKISGRRSSLESNCNSLSSGWSEETKGDEWELMKQIKVQSVFSRFYSIQIGMRADWSQETLLIIRFLNFILCQISVGFLDAWTSLSIMNYWLRNNLLSYQPLTLCHPRWVWFDFRHPFVVRCENAFLEAFCVCWSRYINLLVRMVAGVDGENVSCCVIYAYNLMQTTFFSLESEIDSHSNILCSFFFHSSCLDLASLPTGSALSHDDTRRQIFSRVWRRRKFQNSTFASPLLFALLGMKLL